MNIQVMGTREYMLAAFGGETNAISGAATAVISKLNVCSGSTAYTVTLPAVSGNGNKFLGILITNTAQLVTIDGNASETIDGSLTRIMWQYESAVLYCDGAAWFKVGGKSIPLACELYQSAAVTGLTGSNAQNPLTYDTLVSGPAFMLSSSKGLAARPGVYTILVGAVISRDGGAGTLGNLSMGVSIAAGATGGTGSSIALITASFQGVSALAIKTLTLNQSIQGAESHSGTETTKLLAGATDVISILESPIW